MPRLFGEKTALRKGLPSLIFASSGRIHEADPLLLPVCRPFTRNTNQWLLDERIALFSEMVFGWPLRISYLKALLSRYYCSISRTPIRHAPTCIGRERARGSRCPGQQLF
jgi:hypothetical protein